MNDSFMYENDNANEHDEMNKGIKLDEDIVQKN